MVRGCGEEKERSHGEGLPGYCAAPALERRIGGENRREGGKNKKGG